MLHFELEYYYNNFPSLVKTVTINIHSKINFTAFLIFQCIINSPMLFFLNVSFRNSGKSSKFIEMCVYYLSSFYLCIHQRYIPLLSRQSPLVPYCHTLCESPLNSIHAQKLDNKVAIEIGHPTTLQLVQHILYVQLGSLKFCVKGEPKPNDQQLQNM